MFYNRGPQALGCGLVPVCGLLGTGQTAGGEQLAVSEASSVMLPSASITASAPPRINRH